MDGHTSPARRVGSPNKTSINQRKSAHSADLDAMRKRLANLAAQPSAGTRTQRLFLGRRSQGASSAAQPAAAAPAQRGISPRATNCTGMAIAGTDSLLEEATVVRMLDAAREDPSLLVTNRPSSRNSGGGGSRQSSRNGGQRRVGGLVGATTTTSSPHSSVTTAPTGLQSMTTAPPSTSASPRPTAGGTTTTVVPPSLSSQQHLVISPQTFLALFRAQAVSIRLYQYVQHVWPAASANVVKAKRNLHRVELVKTLNRLEHDAISLPVTADRMTAERRTVLGRDIGKGIFHSNIFLSQHCDLDPRHAYLKRREKFLDDVEDTVRFLVTWEERSGGASVTTSAGGRRVVSPGGGGGRSGSRGKTSAGAGSSGSGGNRAKGPRVVSPPPPARKASFVLTSTLAARRVSRRNSLRALQKDSSSSLGSTNNRFTGVLDVNAIKQKRYPAQDVVDNMKRYKMALANASARRGGRGGAGASPSPRRRSESPTRGTRRTTASVVMSPTKENAELGGSPTHRHSTASARGGGGDMNNTGVSWVNDDMFEFLSPLTPGTRVDRTRWADITEGVFEAGGDMNNTGVSWVNDDMFEFLSPLTPGTRVDRTRWADITEGVFEASLVAAGATNRHHHHHNQHAMQDSHHITSASTSLTSHDDGVGLHTLRAAGAVVMATIHNNSKHPTLTPPQVDMLPEFGNGNDRTAKLLRLLEEMPSTSYLSRTRHVVAPQQQQPRSIFPGGRSTALGVSHITTRSNASSSRATVVLAPLPREVQIAASRLGTDATSTVLDGLLVRERNVQEGYEQQNKDVKFWFGRDKDTTSGGLQHQQGNRLPLDRMTASLRMRQLSPVQESKMDDRGLIDGRPAVGGGDEQTELSRDLQREGIMYSTERIVQVRKAAALAEVKDMHKRRNRRIGGARGGLLSSQVSDDGNGDVTGMATSGVDQQQRSVANNGGTTSGRGGDNVTPLTSGLGGGGGGGGGASVSKRKLAAISEYHGPNHSVNKSGSSSSVAGGGEHGGAHLITSTPPIPNPERLRELLSTVFVRGGNVKSYTKKLEREATLGLKKPDLRHSHKDRLGGGSVPRSVLKVDKH
ncbi:Hypothetical protein, putative [Bodo saltans]|uniref:Uncharacterized protein n=1 Tax=Bodo saltans TaxID=75058 RepID=A0A0S4JD07_BODSA|nr:Hypothetical protein, putative [Bodo saltans]|eukprot:CUG88022.1 Hypothetical protein, putative [Bodo saltans]